MIVTLISDNQTLVIKGQTPEDIFKLGKIVGRFPRANHFNEQGNPGKPVVELPVCDVINQISK